MKPRRASPATARGFTLIEVMVALAIVSLGMTALLTALNSAATTTLQLRERALAQWVAANQLALARLTPTAPAIGESEGSVEFANRRWQWRSETSAMEVPGVFRIELKARAEEEATSDEDSWLATVFGFRGTAGNSPSGNEPDWSGTALAAGGRRGTAPPDGPPSGGPQPGDGGSGAGNGGGERRGGPPNPGAPADPAGLPENRS